LTAVIMYFGKSLFIPLSFGLLTAMIMYPVCKWLEVHGWHRALAIAACLMIVAILLAGLLALLAWQLISFSKDAPDIMNRLDLAMQQFQTWVMDNFRINAGIDGNWRETLSETTGRSILSNIQHITGTFVIFFLTPIFTALFLYHRKIFVEALQSIIPVKFRQRVDMILQQTIHTYFNFIKGMALVYLIVGILNSIGLFLLGVKHPLLFGMLCAIMTIIPYIGTIISASLPISMVWMQTGNIWYPLGVVALFAFVQWLEANIIYPKAVGSQLNVSTFAMLVAMISGGIIWGIAGMILFIPFAAIVKIMSDNIDEWKPLNLLLSRK
jgi:predicted PurR-regulated permease PerM